jgi:erythromycin esterase-like protein
MERIANNEPNLSGSLGRQILTLSSPLENAEDLDPLLERIGDARYVLLGEASHGTHEYYLWRARISRRLIEEKGFRFIAVEGDWPDCYRVNRYIQGELGDTTAEKALRGYNRWPTWMWANWEVVALAEWLRQYNEDSLADERVGFYGLDVYSLWESLYEIINYLKQHHPDAVAAAYRAFLCFEPYAEDPQEYARATLFVPDACRQEVLDLLRTVRERVVANVAGNTTSLDAVMNAEAVKNAAAYYRTMVGGGLNRGTCATGTWPTRSIASYSTMAATPKRSSGSTTPTSAMLATQTWRTKGCTTLASWCGRSTAAMGWCWLASAPTRGLWWRGGAGAHQWR